MSRSVSRVAAVALLGGTLTLVALTFDSPTLFVPGVGLLLVAIGAVLWAAAVHRSLTVSRRTAALRVGEGEPLAVTVELRRRLLRPRRIVLCEPLLGEPRPLALPAGGGAASVRFKVSFPRRGRHPLGVPAVRVGDPLNLVRLTRRASAAGGEILVLPSISRVHWPSGYAGGGTGERHHGGEEPLAAVEVDGVRPYRPGSPASRIHWASAARGLGLMERRLRADSDDLPLIVLDPAAPAREEHLDQAVRAAASLAMRLAARGGCRLMISGQDAPLTLGRDLAAWPRLHEALALVAADRGRLPGQGFRPPAAPLLIYVCAAAPAALGLTTDARHAALLVLPDEVGGSGAAELHVAGCSGRRLRVAVERAA